MVQTGLPMIHNDDLTSEPRIISAAPASKQEEALERALRPKQLDEYVGQEKIRGQLEIIMQAAKQGKEPLDHVLPYNPSHANLISPGLIHHPLGRKLAESQRVARAQLIPRSFLRGALITALTPDAVLDALDSVGLRGDGRLLALNSYESRVYQARMGCIPKNGPQLEFLAICP
jgi:hypothetical protein